MRTFEVLYGKLVDAQVRASNFLQGEICITHCAALPNIWWKSKLQALITTLNVTLLYYPSFEVPQRYNENSGICLQSIILQEIDFASSTHFQSCNWK